MPQLAIFFAQPPQAIINNIVWVIGLALQLALLIVLFRRHIARRFPCFTILIGFYLLRSALLFISFGHIDADDYQTLYSALILVDLLAQTAVAIELIHHLVRSLGGWTLRRSILPAIFLFLASICTLFTATLLPRYAPIPVDRTQLFFSFLMILLFAWAQSIPASSTIVRGITSGFALYGIINISANLGRTFAALHKNPTLYATWSYALAAIYLLVVLFWLLTLKRPHNATSV